MASQQAVVEDEAFVTLATNDTYAVGALVLAHSLRNVGTTRRLAIMITMGVTQGVRQQLSEVFDVVTVVNVLDSRDNVNLALLTRPDLGVTFTKLHCWRLTQFSKCVFLDADTLVLHNVDELFEREELSAAPDAGWPDCFNSGVFVFRPSEETYQSLLQFAVSQGSFDGGDQGLLNMYFHDWATKDINKHLPFIYNVVSQAFYSYLPAFRYYGKTVKIVHFIGAIKPWHHSFNLNTGEVEPLPDAGHNKDYLQQWWTIFMQKVQPGLAPSLFGSGTQNELFSFTWTSFGPHSHHHDHLPPETFSPPTVISYYRPSETSESFDIHVVENKDHRYFAPLEAHYTEPPMSHAEEYPASLIAYEAKDFYQKINEFSATTHREAETENNTDSEIVVSLPYNTDTVSDGGSEEIEGPSELIHVQVVEPVVEQKTQVEKEKLPSFGNRERTEANSECTNDVNQEMGLVGQLASLRIERGSGYTQEQLDDRNRQVEWERGQIDYMGIDSFSNIQKRLDTMIDPKQQAAAVPAAAKQPAAAPAAAKQPAAAPAAAKQPAAAPATAKQPAAKQPTSKAPTGRGATKPAPGKKS